MSALCRVFPAALLSTVLLSPSAATFAEVQTITTFQDALQLPTPAPNWAYLWNASGPIGNPANYQALIASPIGRYTTDGSETFPTPLPGNNLFFGFPGGLPGGHPGSGANEGGFERYCIAAYTLTVADAIGIQDGFLRNINPNSGGSTDGLNLKIFVNDNATPLLSTTTAPSFNSSTSFNVGLGALGPGDTIYVAIGSRNSDRFDGFELRYRIVTVPEPSAVILAIFVGLFLWFRCRRSAPLSYLE